MKVPGSDRNSDVLKRVQEGRVQDHVAPRKTGTEVVVGDGGANAPGKKSAKVQADTMTISSLGAMLRQELDPAKMIEERRAKVESLKERIRSGSYAPPTEAVAQSLSEEVTLEVLLGGGNLQDGENSR
jgi:anti-sigma28 factor (negative regulator of flagellin synthesis)